ncbi:MAG: antibiotic biosynthesis monooxygenase [Euryarchaeota archaeon]|nr:antibiotic biosynthesis monooxygenase [Euryarchaeota archaeon]
MILRTYRAQVKPAEAPKYEAFERDEGVAMVTTMPGCLGAGFGRVREETEVVYLFASLWESQKHLDSARASSAWKAVVRKLEALSYTVGEDRSEHVDLVRWSAGKAAKR